MNGATTGGEKVDAFAPFDLPPTRPAFAIDGNLERRLGQAEQALNRYLRILIMREYMLDLNSPLEPSVISPHEDRGGAAICRTSFSPP